MAPARDSINDTSAPRDVAELEDQLSTPNERVIETFSRLDGDVMILGAGGKMGPTLARMARRAADAADVPRRVFAVSRFSDDSVRRRLQSWGVETIRCDLLDAAPLAELPDAANLVYMAGRKFGSSGDEALTWAMNCYLPGLVCRRFAASRLVAFSTGNVYGMVAADSGGSRETDPPRPQGDYAMSCLGRERILEHFSRRLGIPLAILRLNYACELRYGVLVDLAQRVLASETIDLTMGHVNVIWQAEAAAMALAALEHVATPPRVVNIAGPETLPVREVCESFGRCFARPVSFRGREASTALLSDGTLGHELLGRPRITAAEMIAWTADWLRRGEATLDKPTHFEVRDGRY